MRDLRQDPHHVITRAEPTGTRAWYLVVGAQTSPPRTMRKFVLLHVATKPCGSSISASSAPALAAWMHAEMQLSLLWLFQAGSCGRCQAQVWAGVSRRCEVVGMRVT